jgi:hypothetical protein
MLTCASPLQHKKFIKLISIFPFQCAFTANFFNFEPRKRLKLKLPSSFSWYTYKRSTTLANIQSIWRVPLALANANPFNSHLIRPLIGGTELENFFFHRG